MNYYLHLFGLILPTLCLCIYVYSHSEPYSYELFVSVAVFMHVIRKELLYILENKDTIQDHPPAVVTVPTQDPLSTSDKTQAPTNPVYITLCPSTLAALRANSTVSPAEQFTASLKEITDWIQINNQPELTIALSPATHYTGDLRETCRLIVTDLFSQHRPTRLQGLLDDMNKAVEPTDSHYILGSAVANLVLCSLGAPHNIDHTHGSNNFQTMRDLFIKSLLVTRDTFFCDFILYSILPHTQVDAILVKDNVNGKSLMVGNKKNPPLPVYEEFKKMSFMTPLSSVPIFLKFQRVFRCLGGIYNLDQALFDAQAALVKASVQTNLDKINQLQLLLWNKTTQSDLGCNPPLYPPIFINELSDSFEDSTSTFSEITTKTSRTQSASTDTTSSESELPEDYAKSKKVKEQYRFKENEASSANPKTVLKKQDTTDEKSWLFVNYDPSNPHTRGTLVHGVTPTSFEDNVLALRATRFSVENQFEELRQSESVFLYNQFHSLLKIGLAHEKVEEELIKLRHALYNLKLNIETFQEYVQEYEKGYGIYQIIRFVNMFRVEMEQIETKNMELRKNKEHNKVVSVHDLGVFAKSASWNLKYVYERFAKFDDAYKKTTYYKHVHELYDIIFSNVNILAKTDNIFKGQTSAHVNGKSGAQTDNPTVQKVFN